MQRSTIAFLALFAACGTLEVPDPTPEEFGNPAPGPSVASITPERGPLSGGNQITLDGTGFLEGTTVVIAGLAATDVVVESDTSITATAPAGVEPETASDVVVFGPDGFAELAESYTYNTEPSLDAISKKVGALAGGDVVEVYGDFLQLNNPGTPTVTIGGVEATDVEVVDDSTVRFTTPQGNDDDAALALDVEVATSNGVATLDEAFTFLRPGLLLGTQKEVTGRSNGIYYFDIPTTRLVKLADLPFGVGRFFAKDDGTILLRFNRQGISRFEWGELDINTGALEFIGQATDTATAGSVAIRATTRVGLNFVAIANSQLGFFDPDAITFSGINGSATSNRGCLAAKNASEVYLLTDIDQSIETLNINSGQSVDSVPLAANPTPPGFLGAISCHGAAVIGPNVIALFMNRNLNERPAHIYSINPSTGVATELAVLAGAFSELEPTPPGGF